jgi:hypothetical protein
MSRFRVSIVATISLSLSLFFGAASADTRLLLTVPERAVMMANPVFGDVPSAAAQGMFEPQDFDLIQVSLRASAVVDAQANGTAFVFIFKNLSPDQTITIRPIVDVVDGTAQVVRILTYRQLTDIVRANPEQASGQGSFFAYGNQRFVNNALAGYAIGSLIAESIRSSNAASRNKSVQFIEKHWLKDEYRIPPLAQVDAAMSFRGAPKLPLTTRVAIGDRQYTFVSPQTEPEAATNYERERRGDTGGGAVAAATSMSSPAAVAPAVAPISAATRAPEAIPARVAPALKGGQDGYQAERLARAQSCSQEPAAIMTAKGPGFEAYSVTCSNGDALAIRCEMGNCRVLK